MKKLAITTLSTLAIILTGCFIKPPVSQNQDTNQNQNQNINQNINTNTSTTTAEIDTSNWKTYPLEISTYYFKYPLSFYIIRDNAFNINLFDQETSKSQIIISLGPGADETSILDKKYATQAAIGHCTVREENINVDCQQVISSEPVVINGISGYRVLLKKRVKQNVGDTVLEISSTPYYSLDLISSTGLHIVMSAWANPESFNDESTTNSPYINLIDSIISTINN